MGKVTKGKRKKIVRRPLKVTPLKVSEGSLSNEEEDKVKKAFFKSLIISFALWQAVFSTALPLGVSAQTATDSATATETPTPTPTVSVTTGDATSSAEASGVANTAVTQVQTPGCGVEPCPATPSAEVATPSATPTPSPASLEVDTNQTAVSNVEATSSSITGNNSVAASGSAQVLTGEALAIANALNLANINVVGANLVWLIENILGTKTGDINLYEILSKLPELKEGDIPQNITVTTNQTASLQTGASASSDTGSNTATASGGGINTGNATSIANAISLANLNLIGTTGVVAVINVSGQLLGNIILPNDYFLNQVGFPAGSVSVETNQTASVSAASDSNSNTGQNTLAGTGGIQTGNATSISNTKSYVNLVKVGDSWKILIINFFGSWAGGLVNWSAPGSSTTLPYGSNVLEQNSSSPAANTPGGGSLNVVTNQSATVNSQSAAAANTGVNSVQAASGQITTGNALAISNNFSLANLVGVGGSFMFGIINILGKWVGNMVVAYPNLQVQLDDNLDTITPGAGEHYYISVKNVGSARANNVAVNFNFPTDVQNPGNPTWKIDKLEPGETYHYQADGTVSPTALANTLLTATAVASTPDVQESTAGTSATDTTTVVLPAPSDPDKRLPNLSVSVKNNVNDFVYPGDTVLASITVANQSPFPARDVKVRGRLTNDHPMPAIPMNWNLGDLKPGQRVRIEFGISLINELPDGKYTIAVEASGRSEAGDEAGSGWVASNFFVHLKNVARLLAPEVLAGSDKISAGSGEVLGAPQKALDIKKYLAYILPTLFIVAFVTFRLKRKLRGESEEK